MFKRLTYKLITKDYIKNIKSYDTLIPNRKGFIYTDVQYQHYIVLLLSLYETTRSSFIFFTSVNLIDVNM